MSFNMVANQSVGPFRDQKGLSAALTKLKMDKDKKYALNLDRWQIQEYQGTGRPHMRNMGIYGVYESQYRF